MNVAAAGLSLIVVGFMCLFLGAAALLPANTAMFRAECVPATIGLVLVGVTVVAAGLMT